MNSMTNSESLFALGKARQGWDGAAPARSGEAKAGVRQGDRGGRPLAAEVAIPPAGLSLPAAERSPGQEAAWQRLHVIYEMKYKLAKTHLVRQTAARRGPEAEQMPGGANNSASGPSRPN